MSTELRTTGDGTDTVIEVTQAYDDSAFGAVSSSGKYLPRLAMYGGNSELVKSGKIPMATYGLAISKDNVQALGAMVDILPIAWRPKAMDISGDSIITVHDHTDPEFKRIVDTSEVRDSGCMFGPEFLVWIPSVKKFAALFMQSKTSRREAPAIKDRLGKPTTLKVTFIKTPKYSWHGIVATQCSTPFDLPDEEALVEETARFNNPPKNTIEAAEEVSPGRDR